MCSLSKPLFLHLSLGWPGDKHQLMLLPTYVVGNQIKFVSSSRTAEQFCTWNAPIRLVSFRMGNIYAEMHKGEGCWMCPTPYLARKGLQLNSFCIRVVLPWGGGRDAVRGDDLPGSWTRDPLRRGAWQSQSDTGSAQAAGSSPTPPLLRSCIYFSSSFNTYVCIKWQLHLRWRGSCLAFICQ